MPVEPQRDPAVRRGAVAQCAEQEAELLLGLLRGQAEQAEDLGLDRRVVTPDRAAAAFLAVDDQVVRLGPDLGRVGVEQGQVFGQRHRERVVLGDVPPLLGVPGQQREPDDPGVVERLRVVQLQLGRQPRPQVRQAPGWSRPGCRRRSGSGRRAWRRTARGAWPGRRGGEELGGRAGERFGLDLEPDQPLGAERAGELGQAVEVLAAVLRAAARGAEAPDPVAGLLAPAGRP